MKVLAIILCLLTIFLSSYPCCQDTDFCDEISNVVLHYADDGQKELPHSKETPCSPFYTCGRCPGFIINYATLEFPSLKLEREIHPIPYIEHPTKEVYFFSLKPPRTSRV